ncbi:hypothetical protein VIGAN_07190500 [Vigna angularis var. angularis]|uniref:Rad21/Rec8-like protein N-terminal domain-containing protein n=2 Tax=Phaseolus angularis TaxID=3914 RepID=A0A0S3SJJ6_PHAAN|nr:sister chromatid cohesion 1 protein 3 [Vigna angularis]BAT93020.1 hypothetical protein VIGAN_07190500 [Vigna angularis var. angularis]
MFYSQTFLARKGPLSTVWIAAHLQHRLKKSHYTTTDIPSTVLRIMDPGVPIALRMSGHLLLGVVRIYSKKVEYLHQDCKDALTGLHKAFSSLQFAQTEEVGPAPFQSVTLPGTFDLDAQNIDYQIDYTGTEDRNSRDLEDITLPDRIPVTTDYYVTVSFDEDIVIDSSHTEVLHDTGPIPMEEDIVPRSPSSLKGVGAADDGPSTQRESSTIQPDPIIHSPPQATTPVDPIEVRRGLGPSPPQATQVEALEVGLDATNDDLNLENPPLFSNLEDNDAEPNRVHDSMIHDFDPERMSVPSQLRFNPPTPPTSQGGTTPAVPVLVDNTPNFVLPESPPIQQPQGRGRKRKQLFDEHIVLKNKFMRSALNNPRDIMRKRMEAPSSSLGIWKLNNSRRKEHMFYQPLLTGVDKNLLDICNGEYIRSKPHLVISEEDHADVGMAETLSPTDQVSEEPIAPTNQPPADSVAPTNQPQVEQVAATNQTSEEPIGATNQVTEETITATSPVTAFDIEVEHARNVAVTPPPTFQSHNVVEDDYTSPGRRDDLTMTSLRNLSVASLGTNIASERMPTLDLAASPSAYGSETMQSPYSDMHHVINSAATDEFWFLNLGNNTPASSQGTSGSNMTLSERTKYTAEYLKRLNPITPILEDPAITPISEASTGDLSDLSLNKILEGKTRHIAARMFFEVLVLQTNRLLDVKQDAPYDDISLKLATTPSNVRS